MDLYELIEQAFKPDGAIVQLGGRHVREQHEYAQAVGRVLMNPDQALGVLEAETGVGKGLGYLIPCMLFIATHQVSEQIIVSTFSRLLQKQLLQKDIPFAKKVVEQLGLNSPKCAFRMGRQAFFSIERTTYTVERLKSKFADDDDYVAQLNVLLAFAIDSSEHGSGLWLDWLDMHSVFPNHVHSRDLCMLYNGAIDNQAFVDHLNTSCDAKLLVTNHATVIGNDNILEFVDSAYLLIADEAHHIPRIMSERTNKQLPLARLNYLLQSTKLFGLSDQQFNETKNLVAAWAGMVADYDRSKGQAENFYVSSGGHKVWLLGQVDYVQQFIVALRKIDKHVSDFVAKNPLGSAQVEYIENLQEALHALNFWVSANEYLYRAVVFSEQDRQISLAVVNPIASRLFAHVCKKLTGRVILTSATMLDHRFNENVGTLVGDLGFGRNEVNCLLRVSPASYGDMKFVLPSLEVSIPTSYDRKKRCNRFNAVWIDYTASMIAQAAKNGKTLVLTYSFEESGLLAEKLSQLGVSAVTQRKGQKLLECLPEFTNGQSSVLISPAGWDGVNIRTSDDRQLLSNVVITRIPNPPKNELENHVAKEYMLSKNIPIHIVENILWLKQTYYCIRMLKQGIGRGIRSPHDRIFMWFADPRMPRHDSPKAKPMIYSIPERFLSNYAKASVFELDGSIDSRLEQASELEIVW